MEHSNTNIDLFWKEKIEDDFSLLHAKDININNISEPIIFKEAAFLIEDQKILELSYIRDNIFNIVVILNYLSASQCAYILYHMEKNNPGILVSLLNIINHNHFEDVNQLNFFKMRFKKLFDLHVFNEVLPDSIYVILNKLITGY